MLFHHERRLALDACFSALQDPESFVLYVGSSVAMKQPVLEALRGFGVTRLHVTLRRTVLCQKASRNTELDANYAAERVVCCEPKPVHVTTCRRSPSDTERAARGARRGPPTAGNCRACTADTQRAERCSLLHRPSNVRWPATVRESASARTPGVLRA